MRIAIVGTGIVGRLMAWHLCQHHEVHLFSKGSIHSEDACSSIAAGMLSPYTELAHMPNAWHEMGVQALNYWPLILESLPQKISFNTKGTLVLSSPRHKNLLAHFINQLKVKKPQIDFPLLSERDIQLLEPALKGYMGIHLAEAQLEPKALILALNAYFDLHSVIWHSYHHVQTITPTGLISNKGHYTFDSIIDCRGMGAKEAVAGLRGLRGEIITCFAPQITLKHTLRLLHPKLSCYVSPWDNHHYAIGATVIESENDEPIRVQSALELLSAASLISAQFLSATIVDMQVGIRPTLPAHIPDIQEKNGIITINGMFRHGFLFAPLMTKNVASTYFGVL